MRGQAESRDRAEMQRRQDVAEERQRTQDALQREQMTLAAEQMRDQRARMQAQDARQLEGDKREAYESGYRDTDSAAQLGGALQLSPMAGTASYGGAMQQAAAKPAFTLGGRGMAKVGSSLAEMSAERLANQQRGATIDQRQYDTQRDATNHTQALEVQDRGFKQQSALQDRALAAQRAAAGARAETATGKVSPKFVEQDNALATMQAMIRNYQTKLKATGTALFQGSGPERAALQTEYTNVVMALKEAQNLGVLSGPDLDLLQGQLTPPHGIKGAYRGKESLDAQAVVLDSTMARRRRQLGASYGQFKAGQIAGGDTATARPSLVDIFGKHE